jgi:RND family efflux transporter MFP subunit
LAKAQAEGINKNKNMEISEDEPVPVKSPRQKKLAIGVILLLLVAGLVLSWLLIKTGPKATRKAPAKIKTTVKVITVKPLSRNVTVTGLGRLIPALEINLQARVSGEVIYLHPDFVPGGIINKGEILVKLDDIDYQLKLQQRQNALSERLADLRMEEGSQTVARQEWELINQVSDDIDQSSKDLALRKPQLAKARANLKFAEAELDKAKIDLARTIIKAPFNGVIRKKNIDLGAQVSSQSSIGILTGTEVFWADIPLGVDKLEWIDLPGPDHHGAAVKIFYNDNFRQGRIIKLQAELDPQGLMARVLIEVSDPLGLKNHKPPLLLGSFVRAEIKGKMLKNVFEIPRSALQEDNQLLVATPENTLHIQPVEVVWKDSDHVYVKQGLSPEDRVIVSNVPSAIEGMLLKIFSPRSRKADQTTVD